MRQRREASVMSPSYLAGKALNALLLDRVETDLERLRLFNAILERGVEVYGPEFLDRINEPIAAQRGRPYRIVDSLYLPPVPGPGRARLGMPGARRRRAIVGRPDAGERRGPRHARRGRPALVRLLRPGATRKRLVELGRADAERRPTSSVPFSRVDAVPASTP